MLPPMGCRGGGQVGSDYGLEGPPGLEFCSQRFRARPPAADATPLRIGFCLFLHLLLLMNGCLGLGPLLPLYLLMIIDILDRFPISPFSSERLVT